MSPAHPSATPRGRRITPRRLWLLALAVAVAGVVATAASAHSTRATAASTVTVKLQNIAFHPAKVTIKAGSTVTWQWLDFAIDTEHNVTSLAKSGGLRFTSSKTIEKGSYSVKFSKPGKYFYECTIHPQAMQGEITVTK